MREREYRQFMLDNAIAFFGLFTVIILFFGAVEWRYHTTVQAIKAKQEENCGQEKTQAAPTTWEYESTD
jgi:hypothetical protein